MSPTGPDYAGTATDGGGSKSWSNVSNATGVADGNVAYCGNVGPGGGGGFPNQLKLTNFGFNLPSTAVIDGIQLDMLVQTTGGSNGNDNNLIWLLYGSSNTTTASNTPNNGQIWPISALTWITHGGSTSLWGRTWSVSDINSTNFGASIASMPLTGTANITVDAVKITIYWHTAPTYFPKYYLYKTFNNGTYVGNFPNVTSEFNFSYDINTAGSQISVKCATSADTSLLPNSALLDESGNAILDENSNAITDDGQAPIVSLGTGNQIIRNGNEVIVYEYGYWNPNGKPVFRGTIERWEADFGGDGGDDQINILIYSDGSDLDNYLVRGNPYTYTSDQYQSSSDVFGTISQTGSAYNRYSQTWTAGAGVTNLGAINIALYYSNAVSTTVNVTVNVYTDPSLGTLLGSTSQVLTISSEVTYTFAFANPIVTTPYESYFFTVGVDDGQVISIAYQDTSVYSYGTMYNATYSGGSGGGGYSAITGDLYFETFSGTGTTTGTYTSVDPTTGMVVPLMNDYIARGGNITYTSSSIQSTGLAITYQFNTNTTYEGLQAGLSVSPNGFYYTVDLGTDLLTFRQASSTADIVLTKGLHIDKMTLIATTEQIVNSVYFTGGIISSGPPAVNLYSQYYNAKSIALYGPHLDRPTNNLVTDQPTADAIGTSEISEMKNEQYQTTVTVLDHTMDISSIKNGMTVGFNGFGNFVDSLIMEIVRIDYTPEEATLTLGILPKKIHQAVEQVVRGVIGLNTVNNPDSPS